ncbi:hypothetical protein IF1G_06852 [Cordyceps javanica]|uniref:Uncharacterized protein n=1 Tax=Cordyceps javanica TaxID=43265 RepID=A0A545UZE6_9HYPO|nr:hypothetical protein IF1G_06852 [Cordyceps javanica]TQW06710.1 hypothetical protein IF2G_06132 [Cordyceps javanica]
MKLTLAITLLGAAAAAAAAPSAPEVMDDETFYSLTLPEYTPSGDRIVDWRRSSVSSDDRQPLQRRRECLGTGGIANGQCVRYYSNPGCADRDHIKGYKPTCAGNCYVDRFAAVKAIGDGTYSTNCELFSDAQCQNSLGSVGGKTGGGHCKNAVGWSMKCYYRC